MHLINVSDETYNQQEPTRIEIVSRRITYTIVPHIEEDNWRKQCKKTQIFEFTRDSSEETQSYSDRTSSSPSKDRFTQTYAETVPRAGQRLSILT